MLIEESKESRNSSESSEKFFSILSADKIREQRHE